VEEDEGCNPLEVRRCRFIASVAPLPEDDPTPTRLPGAMRDPGSPVGILLVVLDRGRVDDEASLGRLLLAVLRTGPFGAPEVRFLNMK
jgi:hypothetical protein